MPSYSVTPETLDSMAASWPDWSKRLRCELFVLPWWLKVWCQSFGSAETLRLLSVRDGQDVVGIAPLLKRGNAVALVGNKDVCDYLDFITLPGRESDFCGALLDHLIEEGVDRLNLEPVRPDSIAMTIFADMARGRGYEVACEQQDVSLETDLPASWDVYLEALDGKQRHELKRKSRKLEAAGQVDYRLLEGDEATGPAFDTFLTMFRESRSDKAAFLTPRMEAFFRALARAAAEAGTLRLGVLSLDKLPVATVMCFDHNNELYLYNSGFDSRYSSLSVGLMSKAFYIRACIEQKKRKFNFLKGDEEYKYHMGGKEIPIFSCGVVLRGQ